MSARWSSDRQHQVQPALGVLLQPAAHGASMHPQEGSKIEASPRLTPLKEIQSLKSLSFPAISPEVEQLFEFLHAFVNLRQRFFS
jgi:hypothetical protein